MVSARYAGPVAALLAFALVPTVIHNYWGAVTADGLTTRQIAPAFGSVQSTPTERKAAWVQNVFDSTDWVERIYRKDGNDVVFFAGRSYDAKRLYHHPELALLRGTETTPRGVVRASARPEIPMHLLTTKAKGRQGIAVYALLYDGRFIDNPVMFQLRTSAALLVSGRKPMTLFLASDLSGSPSKIDDAPATRVLLDAIASFERQASSPSASAAR